jgi:GT2 family glycosyltransferase
VRAAAKMAIALKDNSEYWMSSCLIYNTDGSVQKTCRRRLMTPLNALSESLGLSKIGIPAINIDVDEISMLPNISEVEAISGAVMMFRKDTFERMGGINEDYFLHVEDMDLCMRIKLHGGKICFVRDAIMVHMLSTSKTTNKFLEFHKAKGFIYYLRKYFPICSIPGISHCISYAIWMRYFLKTCNK